MQHLPYQCCHNPYTNPTEFYRAQLLRILTGYGLKCCHNPYTNPTEFYRAQLLKILNSYRLTSDKSRNYAYQLEVVIMVPDSPIPMRRCYNVAPNLFLWKNITEDAKIEPYVLIRSCNISILLRSYPKETSNLHQKCILLSYMES